ncbi:Alanine--glyoxylate aminotransferase 2-like 2 mitochondrial [Melia azedarach]|uniref:Alanine--glyoxylate aminotransferase 2-like 2 mitochondrial n=1 Tax=Melia azedarach TaxID=155640 RepID=A0ACC1WZF9_MELAZ|nr:Alanine--glyoxylate aminotransferase 2-like 2 mitochondrial [Melia azedarach]
MQRFVARRVLSETNFLRLRQLCLTFPPKDTDSQNNNRRPKIAPVPDNYKAPKYDGPCTEKINNKRQKYLGPPMVPFYGEKPLNLVVGHKQYVFDETGERYVDAFAGVAVVSCGHCHPDVVEAVVNQMKLLQHTTVLYLNHVIADYAEALATNHFMIYFY